MEWKDSNVIVDDDEMAYGADAKFKQFGTAVDKALKSFEYSTEWADLISCLGKLNKVISTYSTFHVIPRKILVGKRLAQCLHPALPSGVHLKALETYKLIFKQIGQPRLTKDLFIYSAGLFPLLAAAAISVKPVLLDLYEEFYVPLGPHLIPGLPGFLIAVLPGIEEGSEFNDRTNSVLEDVCQKSQKESFFSSLWGCILHSPQIRLPAVTFAVNHLAKHSDVTDRRYVFGNDSDLMVNGICSALEDSNVLVQRIMLDFLLAFVPLDNKELSTSDIVGILVCCLHVVLRRDMSLNRRLYHWILGAANDNITDDSSRKSSMGSNGGVHEEHIVPSSFEKVTKKYVVAAVVTLFKSISGTELPPSYFRVGGKISDKLKPFRVLVSLLDKPEIGSTILEDVLIEVFRALYRECNTTDKGEEGVTKGRHAKSEGEVIKTANILFNQFESYYIWDYLERALRYSFCKVEDSNPAQIGQYEGIFEELEMVVSQPDCAELFTLTDFLLDVVSVEAAVETQTDHWPSLLNCIITQMTNNSMEIKEIYQGVLLASKLLSRISPNMKSPIMSRKSRVNDKSAFEGTEVGTENHLNDNDDDDDENEKSTISHGKVNEVNSMQLCVQQSTQFFNAFVIQWILRNHEQSSMGRTSEETHGMEDEESSSESTLASTFAASCRYLVEVACFPCWQPFLVVKGNDENVMSNWLQSLVACVSRTESIDIKTVAMGTLLDLVNISLCVFPSGGVNHRKESAASVIPLISHADFILLDQSQVYKEMALILWNAIRPDNCQVHSACADLFLRLHNISPNALLCEDVVSNTMVAQSLELRRRAHWKFAVLWHLSRDFYKNESSKSSRGGNRSLDRCMMLMLDSLQSNDPVIAKCSEQWLQHAIHCGDIGRIIEPLLITMLNPTSRRVSVHFASSWDTSTRETEADAVSQDLLSDSENDPLYNSGGDALEDSSSNDCADARRSVSEPSDSFSHESRSHNEKSDESLKVKHDEEENVKRVVSFDDVKEESTKSLEKTKHRERLKDQHRSVNALDVHKLFYTQLYDTTQTMYALKTMLSILDANGNAFVFSAATTSMNICGTVHQIGLRELLIRHRRALTGKDFYGSLAESQQLLIKASTAKYMEIVLSICLYFIRSEYHPSINATESDLEDNFRVRVWSLHVMTKVLSVLLDLVAEGDVAFSNFVSDLFDRCKVQRIALHCLLSSVYNLSTEEQEIRGKSCYVDQRCLVSEKYAVDHDRRSEMQRRCLQFIKKLVYLEERIGYGRMGNDEKRVKKISRDKRSKSQQKGSQFEFIIGLPIVSQPMFLCVLLSALREEAWNGNHDNWIKTVMEILPKSGSSLPKIVIPVVDQIFITMKNTTILFFQAISGKLRQRNLRLPVDYFLKILENVTEICHHCLIEKESMCSTNKSKSDTQRSEAPSIFDSLVHVFSSQSSPNRTTATEEVNEPWMETKQGLLSILPAILSSVVLAWNVWSQTSSHVNRFEMTSKSPLPIGQPKSIRQAILQLLTPVAMQNTPVFFAAVADVWNSSRQKQVGIEFPDLRNENEAYTAEEKKWIASINQKSLPSVTPLQESLLEMILSIKVLSIEKIIDSSRHILRQTMASKERSSIGNQSLEVNLLQFIYAYLQRTPKDQLFSIKSILMSFLRDGMNFNASPQILFVLLSIYHLFVSHIQCPDDKRSRKELQDLAIKFFEAMNTISGASLESSTWFRRNVTVLPNVDQSENEGSGVSIGSVPSSAPTASLQTRNSQYSANALCLMSEILASMLDLLYISEEKDRITSFLFYVMYNVTPYLKNHSVQNVAHFRASSALLASITDYQYTLRSWKKDVHELFLESEFFKMDHISLRFWRCIIDHLMTYDNTTFRDLVARINMTQSGAINIFANREQEIEQRASLLKRLSFAIFCGETDQYHNYMPDIQERLVESLRQIQAPLLYQQVFFCFRILILRMSPHHLTSLWPHLITELVTVFLRIERELTSTDNQRSKNSVIGTIESFFTLNGLTKSKEKWLLLYLEACKLLDLFFALECDDIPHFQSYRWAFVGTPGVDYDHIENMIVSNAVPDKSSINAEKPRTSTNGSRERPQDKTVSKLSVINAPLSSKLRKNEKKASKEKANAERKTEPTMQMKFAPYLSKLTILLSQKCADSSNTHQKSVDRKKNGTIFTEKEANSAKRKIAPLNPRSNVHNKGENVSSEGMDASELVSSPGPVSSLVNEYPASNSNYSDVIKIAHHPLEFVAIDSIFDLLPFLESVSSVKKDDKKQAERIQKGWLEELTEKDFQENLCDKHK